MAIVSANFIVTISAVTAFLCIPLAVISGFALTPLQIIFSLPLCVYVIKNRLFAFTKSRLFLAAAVFMIYALAASTWAFDTALHLKSLTKIALAIIMIFMMVEASARLNLSDRQKNILLKCILLAFAVGCLFFTGEIYSGATINRMIRETITPERSIGFSLDTYNKAACFLAIFIWPVLLATVTYFTGVKKIVVPLVAWACALYLLSTLESMSAFVGFLCASAVFLFVSLTRGRFNILIRVGVLTAVAAIPFAAYFMEPSDIINKFPDMPASAKHRLIIWDFTAKKAAEKPIAGWGIRAAKIVPGGQEQISLDGVFDNRHILPSHPHNGALQIWLELGAIGLFGLMALLTFLLRAIDRISNLWANSASHASFMGYFVVDMLAFDIWREWWISTGILVATFLSLLIAAFYRDNSEKQRAS